MRFLRHFATRRHPGLERVLFASVMLILAFDVPAQNAPVVTVQPASQTVLYGFNAAFTVVVSGSGPFRYQWQFNGIQRYQGRRFFPSNRALT